MGPVSHEFVISDILVALHRLQYTEVEHDKVNLDALQNLYFYFRYDYILTEIFDSSEENKLLIISELGRQNF